MEGTLEELRRISNCPEGATFSQLGLRKSVVPYELTLDNSCEEIWWQSGTDDAMIGALKSIEPIGFLSFAPASAGINRADVDRRIIQNCPYGRGAAACAGMPVWFRLRRLRVGNLAKIGWSLPTTCSNSPMR